MHKRLRSINIWPIDRRAAETRKVHFEWPEHKRFALILTHDVDTAKGHDKCIMLMEMEKKMGFRSSFNFVPLRYHVSSKVRNYLTNNGYEVGVHGLYHDGKYYDSKEIFMERAVHINKFLHEWGAVGFRTPSMLHNLEWLHSLNIEYDASTFDTDPFEPQSDGVATIFPFWVEDSKYKRGYIELPYTLSQDFTLFVLLREKSISIWKEKLDWIAENGGMALLNTHPDYMNFGETSLGNEEYAVDFYKELLYYLRNKYEDQYWHALPKEIARFWKKQFA